jgi:SAM-dependent methyltransferase
VGERVTSGRLVGVDRSGTAARRAAERNDALLRSGRLRLVDAPLAEASGLLGGPFDLAFAVNVNVFWLDGARELSVLRDALEPGGRLYLFYEPPSPAQTPRILAGCRTALTRAGFTLLRSEEAQLGRATGLVLAASRPG